MQKELDQAGTKLPIQLIGVNDAGYETGNASVTNMRTLPWLQPTAMQDVWEQWKPTYRDVVILDGENKVIGIYNLTANDLSNPANYAALKALLLAAANSN
jgi:hypothetical protein